MQPDLQNTQGIEQALVSIAQAILNQTTSRRQMGWTQFLGNGTSSNVSVTVSIPTPVSKILSVSATFIGYRTGGAAGSKIEDFDTAAGNVSSVQCRVNSNSTALIITVLGTSNFGPAYHGIAWSIDYQ